MAARQIKTQPACFKHLQGATPPSSVKNDSAPHDFRDFCETFVEKGKLKQKHGRCFQVFVKLSSNSSRFIKGDEKSTYISGENRSLSNDANKNPSRQFIATFPTSWSPQKVVTVRESCQKWPDHSAIQTTFERQYRTIDPSTTYSESEGVGGYIVGDVTERLSACYTSADIDT